MSHVLSPILKCGLPALALATRLLVPNPSAVPERAPTPAGHLPRAVLRRDELPNAKAATGGFTLAPRAFEANRGQADPGVRFLARGGDFDLLFRDTEVILSPRGGEKYSRPGPLTARAAADGPLSMKLEGAAAGVRVSGEGGRSGKVNYLIGRDRSRWLRGVETFGRVRYGGVYPGIDLVFYRSGRGFEYDFIVSPGSDPSAIRMSFKNALGVELGGGGDLVVRSGGGAVTHRKPFLYQESAGGRRAVEGGYKQLGPGEVGFDVGDYDRALPLVIDPVLAYASYFGDESAQAVDVAVGPDGSAYLLGNTSSDEFPTTPGAFRRAGAQNGIAFVTKLTPDGSDFVYSTFIGGDGGSIGRGLALDRQGNAYVTGLAVGNFPTRGAFQSNHAGGVGPDAFLAKLNPDGSDLAYATLFGGTGPDGGLGLAVDASGNAYVSGSTDSADLPVSAGAFRAAKRQGGDFFVAKFDTGASGAASLAYSTFFDVGGSIAVDGSGAAYVTGGEHAAIHTGLVNKLSAGGTTQLYSFRISALPQNPEDYVMPYAVAVDPSGSAYVTGRTKRPSNSGAPALPTHGAFQPQHAGGQDDAFVAKINPPGTALAYSTFLGGSGNDIGRAIAVGPDGHAYAAGVTTSADFPLKDAFQGRHNGGVPDSDEGVTLETGGPTDLFVARIDAGAADAASLVFSTYYGLDFNETAHGVAVAEDGSVFVGGGLAPTATPGVIHTPRFRFAFGSLQATPADSPVNDNYLAPFVIKLAGAGAGSLRFSSAGYTVGEGSRAAEITVVRAGDASSPAAVDFATLNGAATERSDYTTAVGQLRFAPGERVKRFRVVVTDDGLQEGDESLGLVLLNQTPGVVLSAPQSASLTIRDNDTAASPTNPVEAPRFFVRQHYLDFLNREPDQPGLNFWANQIIQCGADARCAEERRVNVSAAFFLSIEFQETGFLAYLTNHAAYKSGEGLGRRAFLYDMSRMGSGLIVGARGWEARLEANKRAFFEAFVMRPEFLARYPGTMSAAQFVSALNANAGGHLRPAERDDLAHRLASGALDRAQVLRAVVENPAFRQREFNRAFVLMQYFGYLRRSPNEGPDSNFEGYNFWLAKLNRFNGNFIRAEMVKAFIVSIEYRQRFGH